MLHLDCVARSIGLARLLVVSCAIVSGLLVLRPVQAQQAPEPAIEQLIRQLHQPLTSGRAAAAARLARYGQRGARATDDLIQCLQDTESDVRLAAAYALGCVQQDSLRALSALVPLLADHDEHVRYSAEWSIARIAKGLHDESDARRRGGLVSTFETALRHLRGHEHQARHRVAIELALARLRRATHDDARLASPLETQPPVEASLPAAPAADGRELDQRDLPLAEAAMPELAPPVEASPPSWSTAPSWSTVPSLPIGALPSPETAEPESEPMGGSRSGGARNPTNRPVKPSATARATGAMSASTSAPQVVEVFYGTNRGRLVTEAPQHELAVGLLATAGGGLLAMLLCLIGFLRSGHRPFAIVALIAIGAVAPFGFQAAQSYSRTTLRPLVAYGGEYRPEIELGVCEVSLPPGHVPGVLESPNLLKLEVKQDVAKHVVLTSVEQLPKERFFEQLHSRMASDGKNILVFIHGYNVSFEDAARRTAQMAADLKFPGAPVFYSWPSQANWYGYRTDKENIELSVTQIKSFLLELAAQSGATTINLVAHSMGNVGLTQALKEMEATSPQPLFNQVVLAAPDIDADIFKNRVAPYIVTKAQHVTLYTSQTDLALIASRYFNSGTRVGDSGSGVLLFPGIDTIDATAVDSSLLGHSYYGSNVSVLTDLGRVLENQPIASRQYLRTIIDAAQPYWAFDPVRISQTPAGGSPR